MTTHQAFLNNYRQVECQMSQNLQILKSLWQNLSGTVGPISKNSRQSFFFKNGPTPVSFSFIFVFSNIIFRTDKCEKCPSSIRCWDSNSRSLEDASPPITTRPGLPPQSKVLYTLKMYAVGLDEGPWVLVTLITASTSVTRLGDLLDFGQLFKAFGNN